MLQLNSADQALLLEALEDLMYKISLQLEEFKGQPNTAVRKRLTKKQQTIEGLQHRISAMSV